MILLDGSALNIALPALQRDLHSTMTGLQWVVTIYTIPLASLLLTAGNLSDRIGARRLFTWSLLSFTAASALCAASSSTLFLVAARAIQGIAAAGVLPTTLAIITRNHPDPAERAKAITVWGATGGLALVAGPLGGGVLTDLLGWRSIFLINLPLGAITVVLGMSHVRETAKRVMPSPDLWGQVTGIAALSALVAGLIEGDSMGWTSMMSLSMLTVTVTAGIAFLRIETRRAHPMLPMALFRRPAFSATVISGFAFQLAAYGMQFMLAVYLQERWPVSASSAGLLFVPFALCWVFGTTVLNRRLLHHGPRRLLAAGATISLTGSLVVLAVSGPATWGYFAVGTALIGLGCGVFGPSLAAAAMMSVDPSYAGLGSGVLNTMRQIGMAVGIAALGALLTGSDLVLGMRLGMAVIAGCFLTIVVLSLRYVPSDGQRTPTPQPSVMPHTGAESRQ